MSQTAIFGPVFATVLLTFLVWVVMYVVRIRFITRSGMSPKELAGGAMRASLASGRRGSLPDRLPSRRRAKRRERTPFHALDRATSWLSEAA
jgi:hypothetical protein